MSAQPQIKVSIAAAVNSLAKRKGVASVWLWRGERKIYLTRSSSQSYKEQSHCSRFAPTQKNTNKKKEKFFRTSPLVPRPGIEPGWVAPLVFETSASTDSAIWAFASAKIRLFSYSAKFFFKKLIFLSFSHTFHRITHTFHSHTTLHYRFHTSLLPPNKATSHHQTLQHHRLLFLQGNYTPTPI